VIFLIQGGGNAWRYLRRTEVHDWDSKSRHISLCPVSLTIQYTHISGIFCVHVGQFSYHQHANHVTVRAMIQLRAKNFKQRPSENRTKYISAQFMSILMWAVHIVYVSNVADVSEIQTHLF
jgi:hypothetical protein